MHFKQFYLGCLAHASYLIGSEGEAAVVDPQRDVEQYVEEAGARGLRIKYVVETHLHADFVSGHQELAARTGAEIVFGARAGAEFPHLAVSDGDELAVGSARLHILETPGHTPESISILVSDPSDDGEPTRVLTGDTLFIGDVGRPDLVAARGQTPQEMAGLLYESLHGKLLALPDSVEVYPAHGAGSMCGRNISKETSSTIGEQRRTNYALQSMEKEAFVAMMTTDLPPAPRYFSMDAQINRTGAPPLAALAPPAALSPEEVRRLAADGAVLLDVRDAGAFGAGHLPGSVNVGLGGQFASWAGSLVPGGSTIVLVADGEEQVREAVVRLARVGLENVAGYLDGGIAAWDAAGLEIRALAQMPVDELRAQIDERRPGLQIVDVRRPGEYASGHVPGAVSAPLGSSEDVVAGLDPNAPTAVICAGGYRSSAAASLLEQRGFSDLYNVVGGTSAWVKAGYEAE
jgi:hydroxyacylglutathione hydrolase